jgi:hypothetical protein
MGEKLCAARVPTKESQLLGTGAQIQSNDEKYRSIPLVVRMPTLGARTENANRQLPLSTGIYEGPIP